MPDFFARVVLHRMDGSDDYTELHAEMQKIGFSQFADNQDPRFRPTRIKMPAGTYFFNSTLPTNKSRLQTIDEAYDAVDVAIAEVIKDKTRYVHSINSPPSVLIIQSAAARWNLEIA